MMPLIVKIIIIKIQSSTQIERFEEYICLGQRIKLEKKTTEKKMNIKQLDSIWITVLYPVKTKNC